MKSNVPGFHYHGKDKRGVSQWTGGGKWQKVMAGASIGMMIYGVCAGIVFLSLLLFALFTLSWPAAFATLLFVSGIHALVFGGTGVWMRRMGQHVQTLDTPDMLCARFGVNEKTLTAVAQDKDIKPRMSINGTDYYNPADFAEDALTLLRGTTRPKETQEVLLRPAATNVPTDPEQLLRVPKMDSEPVFNNSAQGISRNSLSFSNVQTGVQNEDALQEIQRQ